MATFKEQMEADLDIFFNVDEFADAIVYDNGSEAVTITALIDYGPGKTARTASHASVTVKKTDVPFPKYREIFIIDEVEYRVDAGKDGNLPLEGDGYTWQVPVINNEGLSSWRK